MVSPPLQVFIFGKWKSIPVFLAYLEKKRKKKALVEMQNAYPRGAFPQTPTALVRERETKSLLAVGCNRNTFQ